MTITIGSLCSGFGGVELGLRAALGDTEVRWLAEVDEDMSFVLKRESPDVPNVGDLTAAPWRLAPSVDLVTAGFPCQPVSAAGRQLGHDDHRWLWPHVLHVIETTRPAAVFLENVQNIVSIQGGRVLAGILGELRAAGYEARWTVLGACAVGAPHHRHRWFLLARRVGPGAPEAVRVGGARAICGAPRSGGRMLLPTVRDSDGRGEGDQAYWSARAAEGRTNGMPLGAAAALLPTPDASMSTRGGLCSPEVAARRVANPERSSNLDDVIASLLPTPTARDGMGGAGRSSTVQGGNNLRTVAQLLPTPRASDGERGRGNCGQTFTGGGETLGAAAAQWGRYAAAVALWESVTGMPAPEPTELAPKGGRRLSPALPEWMMGLPPGYLTADLARAAALRGAGNGVCPPQVAAAWALLTA